MMAQWNKILEFVGKEDKNPATPPYNTIHAYYFQRKRKSTGKLLLFGAYHVGQLVLLVAPQQLEQSGFSQGPKVKEENIKQ